MRTISLTLVLCFFSLWLLATEKKEYHTTRTDTPPRIDGMFDEASWNGASWQSDFTQFDPDNGAAALQETEFAIMYDDANIYVAFKCHDTEAQLIDSRLTRRDGWGGDLVGIHFDSYFDKRTSFQFFVSASGVKNDGFTSGDDGDNFDDSWDPIWYVKTNIHASGWDAEMRIPLSQLRFADQDAQIWGLQVARNLFRSDEWSLWQHIPNDVNGWVSLYGELHGLNNIKARKQVELAPFVVAKTEIYEAEEGNPYQDGQDYGIDAGLDGKIGITNDLILDFAINPDFGQVEADPSQVNLSAYEVFFQERRPFFIEGSNITDFQITPGGSPFSRDNLFYSRRIGKTPSLYPDLDDNEYADISGNTRMLGSFKLTGKTNSGWSVGVVESVTQRVFAKIDREGVERKLEVEPLTNYLVGRLQKDMNEGNTILGGMVTSVNRDLQTKELNFLPKSALTGGIDFTQYFQDRKYFFVMNVAASHVKGSEEAIYDLQKSSRRLFQRPDADYLSLDPNKTALTGYGGNIAFGSAPSSGLRGMLNLAYRSPGFELNDIGYLRQSDIMFQFIWLGYRVAKPFSIFRSFNVNFNQWAGFDFEPSNLFKGGNVNMNAQFNNFWSLGMGMDKDGVGKSNSELRGGPALHMPGNLNFWMNIHSNSRKKMWGNVGFNTSTGTSSAFKSRSIFGSISYRPTNSLSISLEPSFSTFEAELQYVDQFEFDDEDRYVFANIDQKTFQLTINVDYSISPNLSVQYYGAPFVSGGLYDDYKRITDPRAEVFQDRYEAYQSSEISYNSLDEIYNINEYNGNNLSYSFDKPDFNFRQFRSNFVIRWEYTPGSLLYLVWSGGKTDYVSDGQFDLNNDLSKLFKTKGNNVFLVKASYRIRPGG